MNARCELRPEEASRPECVELPIRLLRRDGETQSRISLNPEIVEEYAELMIEAVELPPVRAWFDGTSYWLTDGFHRVAAAESSGKENIRCEVFQGLLEDAQWDSYRANAIHGLRRTSEDLKLIVTRALQHGRALRLSNRELARHLHVSEKTIRRFRDTLTAARAADECIAIRNGREYKLHTANIGKSRKEPRRENTIDERVRASLERRLSADLLVMDQEASADVRRILIIFRNWTQRGPNPLSVLRGLETLVAELKGNRIPRDQVRWSSH